MQISDITKTGAVNSVLTTNFGNQRNNESQDEGWLADIYRYSSSAHQAQRVSQRMLNRLKRHYALKEKSQS